LANGKAPTVLPISEELLNVEGLNDARTLLADFFSILLEEGGYDAYNRKVLWDRPAR
jgi:hypothetical protein